MHQHGEPAKAASTISDFSGPRAPSSTAIATIGPSSPYAPWFIRVAPKRVAEQAAVLEDRQQRAERRRGERDGHGDLGVDGAGVPSSPITASASASEATQVHSARRRPADELLDLDLVAREQEQHAETELAQHADALVGRGEVERRADR